MPSPLRVRSPLEDTTNESRSPTPSPPQATAKRGPVLRRKPSNRAFHPNLDSSESYPSPHSSIYEASFVESSTEHINWYDSNAWNTPSTGEQAPASWEDTVMDPTGNAVPASFLQETPSPKKHTPHKLYPITEQNSLATLRPGASFSTLKGIRPISPGLNGKKQKSFSTSDLPPASQEIQPETPSPPSSPQEFFTPVEPHRPPPTRMPTPPNLPKFNTPAASAYRLPPPTVRFRDKFRSPTPAEREWAMQTVGLPRGVVMRGENGVLVRGKFTPIRSGHFPPQRQQNPIFRMGNINDSARERSSPRPVVVDRNVGFTGPRRERSHMTRDGVLQIGANLNDATQREKKKEGKCPEKVLKRLYYLVGCCCLCEKWDLMEGGTGTQRGFDGSTGGAPLFVGGFNARER